jgi:hypothetical protein
VTFVVAAIAGILTAELIARFLAAGIHTRMTATTRRSMRTLARKGVSDHWKERVMLQYSRLLFLDTLRVALVFGLIAAAILLLQLAARGVDVALLAFLVTPIGMVYVTAVASVYLWLRHRVVG